VDEEGATERPTAIRTDDGRLTLNVIEFTMYVIEVQLMNARSIKCYVSLPTWFSFQAAALLPLRLRLAASAMDTTSLAMASAASGCAASRQLSLIPASTSVSYSSSPMTYSRRTRRLGAGSPSFFCPAVFGLDCLGARSTSRISTAAPRSAISFALYVW